MHNIGLVHHPTCRRLAAGRSCLPKPQTVNLMQEAMEGALPTTILTTGERPQAFEADSVQLTHGFLAVFVPEAALRRGSMEHAQKAATDEMARAVLVAIAEGCTVMHTNKVRCHFKMTACPCMRIDPQTACILLLFHHA